VIEGAVAGLPEPTPAQVFINPEITWLGDEIDAGDEGCLSFPGVFVPVKRSVRARVRAMDLEGKTFEAEGEGLFARAIQHENDHLTGRLLIDMVGALKREMIKRKLKREAAREDSETDAP
jgi:peptide deformylase